MNCPTSDRKVNVEHLITKRTHKPIALRFWVRVWRLSRFCGFSSLDVICGIDAFRTVLPVDIYSRWFSNVYSPNPPKYCYGKDEVLETCLHIKKTPLKITEIRFQHSILFG